MNAKRGIKGFVKIDLISRFYAKVDSSGGPDACWPWLGATDGHRRGMIYLNGKNVRAPRVAWALFHGRPFPENLLACHKCDNPNCVNPHHIFPGTMSDNILDAVAKGRHVGNSNPGWQKDLTECHLGHPFSPENTYTNALGFRRCRICQRRHDADYRERKRAAIAPTPATAGKENV